MPKFMMTAVILAALIGSVSAANIDVAAGSSIQAAINSAADGDTITLTSSVIYKENLRINKSIKLVAAIGQNPRIEQADQVTTYPVLLLPTAAPYTCQIGSLNGGRIQFQYLKWSVGNTVGTLPYGIIGLFPTTGSTVRIENCDIITTGPTNFSPISGIQQGGNPCSVTIAYTNIDLKRGDFNGTGAATPQNTRIAHGIDLSNLSARGAATYTRRIPGPDYTLDHVRIKNYTLAGVWLHFTSMTLTANYVDIGTFGENTVFGSQNAPWGPIISFNAAAVWTGRISNSIFQGPLSYAAFGKIGNDGTSISLSRSVLVGSGGVNAAYGAIDIGTQNAPVTGWPVNTLNLSIDHCDIVHLGASPASALVKNTAVANSNMRVKVSNSNIYSQNTKAMNITTTDTQDVYMFNNNNIFGAQANTGYIGFVAATDDISYDPLYFDAAAFDFRYTNNTLKTADSNGGPVGVNADYSDVVTGIIPGNPGIINAARNWMLVK